MLDESLFRQDVVDHRSDRLSGAVVLTQPPSTRWLVAGICMTCAAALIFVSVGTYARVEAVPGVVVTDQPAPAIMAPQSGVIQRLRVREGMDVRSGDELAMISTDRSSEAGQGAAVISLHALQTRIELSRQQGGIAQQKRAGERAQLDASVAASAGQIAALDNQIETQRDIVASDKALFEQMDPVMARGYVSKVDYERRRQTWLSAQQVLSALIQQQLGLKGQARQSHAQLAQLGAEAAKDTNDTAAATNALEQQRAELDAQRVYVLRAPVTGRITAIQCVMGGTVIPGAVLMTIVPAAAQMRVDLYAPSRAIGFVHPGQETRLLYDAFPYQRFGSFRGTIATVSRAVIDPRAAATPIKLEEPAYKISVLLDDQYVAAYGRRLPLESGMLLRGNIILERQSFLDWLLSPLRAVRNRS